MWQHLILYIPPTNDQLKKKKKAYPLIKNKQTYIYNIEDFGEKKKVRRMGHQQECHRTERATGAERRTTEESEKCKQMMESMTEAGS